MSQQIAISVDLGGTLVRVGAFDKSGQLLGQCDAGIASIKPDDGLRLIEQLIHKTLDSLKSPNLLGIGIGSTGPLDAIHGIINNPYTLSGWSNIPIVERIKKTFNVPVRLENDADAAALGEYWHGAGRGAKRLYAVTVGTGVGTALIVDGKIYRGMDGSHPEGGHQLIDPNGPKCYCGYRGCWESLISGTAISSAARGAKNNEYLIKLAGGDPDHIDARHVADAARENDPLALTIIQKAARDFSLGMINVISFFVPDVIVLSGGVMKSADLFLPTLETTLKTPNPMVPFDRVQIVPALLGYHAGLYGGACMILSEVI
ncbi:MAG TPA: ROK family protein [Anaerolineales bacterium]|nr:ROK family protein [Anaerolineales bacterium]